MVDPHFFNLGGPTRSCQVSLVAVVSPFPSDSLRCRRSQDLCATAWRQRAGFPTREPLDGLEI
jgi:hypothetical protein